MLAQKFASADVDFRIDNFLLIVACYNMSRTVSRRGNESVEVARKISKIACPNIAGVAILARSEARQLRAEWYRLEVRSVFFHVSSLVAGKGGFFPKNTSRLNRTPTWIWQERMARVTKSAGPCCSSLAVVDLLSDP